MNEPSKPFDKALANKILQVHRLLKEPFEVTVTGRSMNPLLYDGDIITIQSQDNYNIGDVLVFNFQDKELLTHRLLLKENGVYFCKGDNVYRLEEVTVKQIIGKVIFINGKPLPPCPRKLIEMSLAVSQQFQLLGRNVKLTKETEEYKLYQKMFLT